VTRLRLRRPEQPPHRFDNRTVIVALVGEQALLSFLDEGEEPRLLVADGVEPVQRRLRRQS